MVGLAVMALGEAGLFVVGLLRAEPVAVEPLGAVVLLVLIDFRIVVVLLRVVVVRVLVTIVLPLGPMVQFKQVKVVGVGLLV